MVIVYKSENVPEIRTKAVKKRGGPICFQWIHKKCSSIFTEPIYQAFKIRIPLLIKHRKGLLKRLV